MTETRTQVRPAAGGDGSIPRLRARGGRDRRTAFTLIELILVVAIAGCLLRWYTCAMSEADTLAIILRDNARPSAPLARIHAAPWRVPGRAPETHVPIESPEERLATEDTEIMDNKQGVALRPGDGEMPSPQ